MSSVSSPETLRLAMPGQYGAYETHKALVATPNPLVPVQLRHMQSTYPVPEELAVSPRLDREAYAHLCLLAREIGERAYGLFNQGRNKRLEDCPSRGRVRLPTRALIADLPLPNSGGTEASGSVFLYEQLRPPLTSRPVYDLAHVTLEVSLSSPTATARLYAMASPMIMELCGEPLVRPTIPPVLVASTFQTLEMLDVLEHALPPSQNLMHATVSNP